MEGARVFTPDIADCVLQQPLSETRPAINHQNNNVKQEEVGARAGTALQTDQTPQTDGVGLSPDVRPESPEEAERWERIICPVRPISCASPQISFATVQWDFPSAEEPRLVTDGSSANEPDRRDAGGVPELLSTSSSPCQSLDGERFKQEGRVQLGGFDPQPLRSHLDSVEDQTALIPDDPCCNLQPCDAADVPETQQDEASQQGLVDKEISWSEEGRVSPSPPGPAQTEDLAVSSDESREEDDSFIDVKLEEEREEPRAVLTEQRDSAEEPTFANEIDENGGGGKEQSEIYVRCHEEEKANDGLKAERITAERLQTGNAGSSIISDKLTDSLILQLLGDNLRRDSGEDNPGQSDALEMCEDADQPVVPEESKVVDRGDEALMQETESSESNESSRREGRSSETEMTSREREDSACLAAPQKEEDDAGQLEESAESKPTERPVRVEAGETERREQTEPAEQNEPGPLTADLPRLAPPVRSGKTNESEVREQLSHEAEVTQRIDSAEVKREERREEALDGADEAGGSENADAQRVVANGALLEALEMSAPHVNGSQVDREKAGILAERLFKLDGIQRADVVSHLDKDNDFSRAVGEEYLKFFDFTGQTLDGALRSFLKVVILIGETQERERVLQHFSCRFHRCNPDSFASSGAVLALTCAMMLLNTDLHGQHVGKSMSSSKFVSNLDEMNEGGNFSKDLLKSLYNSIKSEPLQWAVDEEELKSAVLLDEDAGEDAPLRSKANPFLDVAHDKQAAVVKQGFLQRKLHADIDGKRTPWGKRGWKTFYGVLKGMVLYLQKDDYRRDQQSHEEVVSVHHSLAEQAADYNKKPHVFRLQTADWRVFLFQASSKLEMNSWISRINLSSALHSSPPFPPAVGSQRRFCRPILPASQSAQTLERQLQNHAGMLESFKADLSYQQQNPPEGRKAKAKDLEEHRVRAEYLQHEVCRYETYIQVLDAWSSVEKTGESALTDEDLNLFDRAVCSDSVGEEDEGDEGGLKRSHSSPSLELDAAPAPLVKVKRNISERRTYRRTIIPRWNKEV